MDMNINQFKQETVRGQLDLQITRTEAISAQISANEAGAPKAGDAVMLDGAITAGQLPQIILAGKADVAIGFLIFDPKKASPVAGDLVSIAPASCVMYMTAEDTIAPGAYVENTDAGTVQLLAAAKCRGILIDPAVADALVRVLITTPQVLQ